MIGAHQSFLDVRSVKPALDAVAAEDVVYPATVVGRPSVALRIPACVHSLSARVKTATEIPQDTLLPAFIPSSNNVAFIDEVIEDPSGWKVHPFLDIHSLLSKGLSYVRRVDFRADDI